MSQTGNQVVTVSAHVSLPVERVWELWTGPEHIIRWNTASEDWHTTKAENDFRVGGKFVSRMEARDGSVGFDFSGVYNSILKYKFIGYTLDDGRNVSIIFAAKGSSTEVTESFEAEGVYPVEHQRQGWQSIMNNFKRYAESSAQ